MPDSHRVGLQPARRRAGALGLPLRRRRQPLPRPRGGRGAHREPRYRAATSSSTCSRSPSAPTGRMRRAQRRRGREGAARDVGRARPRTATSGWFPRARAPGGSTARRTGATSPRRPWSPARRWRTTDEIVVFGRRGGPEVLDSELARLAHLAALAVSIARAGCRRRLAPIARSVVGSPPLPTRCPAPWAGTSTASRVRLADQLPGDNLPPCPTTPAVSEIFDPAAWRRCRASRTSTDLTYHRAVEHGTVRIAFDRPEVRNAFRPHTVDELLRVLEHARDRQRRRLRAAHRQRPVAEGRRLGVLLRRRPADPRPRRLPVRRRGGDDAPTTTSTRPGSAGCTSWSASG